DERRMDGAHRGADRGREAAPWKAPANVAVAAINAALAIAVALMPSSVPGLTIPGSAAAERAMSTMGHSHMQMHARPGRAMSPSSMRTHAEQAMPGIGPGPR